MFSRCSACNQTWCAGKSAVIWTILPIKASISSDFPASHVGLAKGMTGQEGLQQTYKSRGIHGFPLEMNHTCKIFRTYSPPARWGLLDFNIALRIFFFFFSSSSAPLLLASSWWQLDLNCQLPPAPDPSGRRWTSTTISQYQWAPLDLNRGPPEPSAHCWTSTAR